MKKSLIVAGILLLLALILYFNNQPIEYVIITLVASAGSFFISQGAFSVARGKGTALMLNAKWLVIFLVVAFIIFGLIYLINPNLIYSTISPTSPSSSPTNTTGGSNATTGQGVWKEVDNVSGSVVIPEGERDTSLISFTAPKRNALYKITFTRKWDFTEVPPWMAGNGDVTWSLSDPNNSTCWSVIDYSRLLQWVVADTNCNYVGTPFTLLIVNSYDAKVTCEYYATLFEWI